MFSLLLSSTMSLTASRVKEGPSVSSPPSLDPGDPNDPSHTLPSLTFVMYQLSVLLSSLGSTANDTYARQQLLAALSNVLCASLLLPQPTPFPAPSSIPVVQTAPTHPRTISPPPSRHCHHHHHPHHLLRPSTPSASRRLLSPSPHRCALVTLVALASAVCLPVPRPLFPASAHHPLTHCPRLRMLST